MEKIVHIYLNKSSMNNSEIMKYNLLRDFVELNI